jgi:hypothetical protein
LAKQSVAPGLLDAYGGAAAAYSLRNLSGAYGGPVVRVRRSSDNTEQDFTATQVTDGTLVAFYGAGSGFVRTWYDQSGNGYNVTQSTQAAQPLFVALAANNKPTIRFDGSNDVLTGTAGIYNNLSTFAVRRSSSVALDAIEFGYGDYRADLQKNQYQISVPTNLVGSFTFTTNYSLRTLVRLSTTSKAYANGTQSGSTNVSSLTVSSNGGLAFGNRVDLTVYTSVDFSEMIIYPSAFGDTTRAAIESNINAHYAIY